MRRSDRARAGAAARGDAGYVTAETATVVPSLVLLVAMLLWGLGAAAGTIRCVDGARAGARAAARGETPAAALEAARSAAPQGAEVELTRDGELVRVRVAARTTGPGPLSLPLEAEAVALAEESIAANGSGGLT
jgi:hypothetical protein